MESNKLSVQKDLPNQVPDVMNRQEFSLKLFSFCLAPLMSIILITVQNTIWFTPIAGCCLLSTVAYATTSYLIPFFAESLKKKGLSGRDLNKRNSTHPIAESLGLVPASIFIICSTLIQLFISDDVTSLLEFNAGLFSVACMAFLGFVDDVLDLRWRYKIILPLFAGLPFAVAYRGSTSVLIPPFFQKWFNLSPLIHLGHIYRLYIILLALFCTNSINIYAGINGLEIGQTLVMCSFVILYNLMALQQVVPVPLLVKSYPIQHFVSLAMSITFFSCCLALMSFNWYPSTVFVGDTFTYFAGIYFSVVGGLGHFSKMILLLFIPQILNFLISLPQLFKFIPCPRHRIPRLSESTGLLCPSPNLTLINLTLWILDDMSEKHLCIVLLVLQALCCSMGLVFYYWMLQLLS